MFNSMLNMLDLDRLLVDDTVHHTHLPLKSLVAPWVALEELREPRGVHRLSCRFGEA
jgi:hypothetical protein